MSPSFSSELRIVLCPDRVILLGLGKGLRRKVTHQAILPCAPMPGMPAWRPALAALEQWLGANKTGRAKVTVILSNHFVRYALMPFSDEVASSAEEQMLAQILLEDTYGDLAKQWCLKISGGGYREPRLVAAVDAELPEAIAAAFASGPLRLNAISPYLMTAFNCFRKQLQGADGLFAVAEPGQVVMVTFRNGQWAGVRRMPLNGEPEQLPDLLQREALIGGLDTGTVPVYLHIAGRHDFKLPPDGGMVVHSLHHLGKTGAPFVEDARFDMAAMGEYA